MNTSFYHQPSVRHLLYLYTYQLPEEQRRKTTVCVNGKGFNKIDAPILTSMSLQAIRKSSLTPKQLEIVEKRLKKYHKQSPPDDFNPTVLLPSLSYSFMD